MSKLKEIWQQLVDKVDKISVEDFERTYGSNLLELALTPNPYFSMRENYLRLNNWSKRFTNFESGKKDEELANILVDYIKNGYKSEYLDIIEEIKRDTSIDDFRIYKVLGRKGYLKYNELPFFYSEEPLNII